MLNRSAVLIGLLSTVVGCTSEAPELSTAPTPDAPAYARNTVVPPTTSWKLPLDDSNLGLRSDRLLNNGVFSVYEDGVCGVTGKIFVGAGSGDATLQTNNPRAKNGQCSGPRKMTVVYPVGDIVYPSGGSETMPVFVNLRNISNDATIISAGYANRVERTLSLNPTQTQRCDAWRWSDDGFAGDKVWVERIDATTYHVYTKDQDPVEANRVAGANRAVCTTTGQAHNLSVNLFVVSKVPLP